MDGSLAPAVGDKLHAEQQQAQVAMGERTDMHMQLITMPTFDDHKKKAQELKAGRDRQNARDKETLRRRTEQQRREQAARAAAEERDEAAFVARRNAKSARDPMQHLKATFGSRFVVEPAKPQKKKAKAVSDGKRTHSTDDDAVASGSGRPKDQERKANAALGKGHKSAMSTQAPKKTAPVESRMDLDLQLRMYKKQDVCFEKGKAAQHDYFFKRITKHELEDGQSRTSHWFGSSDLSHHYTFDFLHLYEDDSKWISIHEILADHVPKWLPIDSDFCTPLDAKVTDAEFYDQLLEVVETYITPELKRYGIEHAPFDDQTAPATAGSRMKKGQWKHSLHVNLRVAVFHGLALRAFMWRRVLPKMWRDGDVVDMIDFKLYAANHPIRQWNSNHGDDDDAPKHKILKPSMDGRLMRMTLSKQDIENARKAGIPQLTEEQVHKLADEDGCPSMASVQLALFSGRTLDDVLKEEQTNGTGRWGPATAVNDANGAAASLPATSGATVATRTIAGTPEEQERYRRKRYDAILPHLEKMLAERLETRMLTAKGYKKQNKTTLLIQLKQSGPRPCMHNHGYEHDPNNPPYVVERANGELILRDSNAEHCRPRETRPDGWKDPGFPLGQLPADLAVKPPAAPKAAGGKRNNKKTFADLAAEDAHSRALTLFPQPFEIGEFFRRQDKDSKELPVAQFSAAAIGHLLEKTSRYLNNPKQEKKSASSIEQMSLRMNRVVRNCFAQSMVPRNRGDPAKKIKADCQKWFEQHHKRLQLEWNSDPPASRTLDSMSLDPASDSSMSLEAKSDSESDSKMNGGSGNGNGNDSSHRSQRDKRVVPFAADAKTAFDSIWDDQRPVEPNELHLSGMELAQQLLNVYGFEWMVRFLREHRIGWDEWLLLSPAVLTQFLKMKELQGIAHLIIARQGNIISKCQRNDQVFYFTFKNGIHRGIAKELILGSFPEQIQKDLLECRQLHELDKEQRVLFDDAELSLSKHDAVRKLLNTVDQWVSTACCVFVRCWLPC